MAQSVLEAIRQMTPWNWYIEQARDGDGSDLAEILRDHAKTGEPLPRDVVAFPSRTCSTEKMKLKRREKLTAVKRHAEKYLREKIRRADGTLRNEGASRVRDKQLRTKLIQEWSDYCGTTAARLETISAPAEDAPQIEHPTL